MDHVVHNVLHALSFHRVFAVVHDGGVEVAVANVPEDAGEEA